MIKKDNLNKNMGIITAKLLKRFFLVRKKNYFNNYKTDNVLKI